MNDTIDDRIKLITELLGQNAAPDNIKLLLSYLMNNSDENNNSSDPIHNKETSPRADSSESLEDPRIKLLSAVQPFLNEKRQNKLNRCIKLLHLTSIVNLMDEN